MPDNRTASHVPQTMPFEIHKQQLSGRKERSPVWPPHYLGSEVVGTDLLPVSSSTSLVLFFLCGHMKPEPDGLSIQAESVLSHYTLPTPD